MANYTTMFVIVVYKTRFPDILLQFSPKVNTISVSKLHNYKNSGTQFCQQNIEIFKVQKHYFSELNR